MKSVIYNTLGHYITTDINGTHSPIEALMHIQKNEPHLFEELFGSATAELIRCNVKTLEDVSLSLIDDKLDDLYVYSKNEAILNGFTSSASCSPMYSPTFIVNNYKLGYPINYADAQHIQKTRDILSEVAGELVSNGHSFYFTMDDIHKPNQGIYTISANDLNPGCKYEMIVSVCSFHGDSHALVATSFSYTTRVYSGSELFNSIANDIATDEIGVDDNVKVALITNPDGSFRINMTTFQSSYGESSPHSVNTANFEFNIGALLCYLESRKLI